MKINNRKISELIPYARNSRTHSDEQISQIAASIKEFGFTNPVLLDGTNGIIAGHGRVMAARKLGLDEVPCIELSHLTDTQKRAYIIADNKLALNSGWDENILALELTDLQNLDLDLDFQILGFSEQELDKIIDLPEMLEEKIIMLKPISWTRILVSIPTNENIDGIDDWLKKVKNSGGQVDFCGN